MHDIREKLKAALASGARNGIDALGRVLSPDSPRFDVFLHQKGVYTNARTAFLDTLMSAEDLQIANSRVSMRLRELIDELQPADIRPPDDMLDEILKKLPIRKDEITEYHLVNCDREAMTDRFAEAYETAGEYAAQFYFISSCDTQMPQLFSERILLELKAALDDSENALQSPILYRKQDDNSQRAEILPLPTVGLGAADAFRKFKSTFCEKILNTGSAGFEDFMAGRATAIRHQYIFALFDFSKGKWRKFFPEYFRLIIDTFSRHPGQAPRFIFLFSFAVHELHSAAPDSEEMAIVGELDRLAQQYPNVAHLHPLQPVEEEDFAAWFRDLGVRAAADVQKVLRALLADKDDAVRRQYELQKLLNMDDIATVQQTVYQLPRQPKS